MKTRLILLLVAVVLVGCTTDTDYDYGPRPILEDPGHASLPVRYFKSCAEVKSFLRERMTSKPTELYTR